MVTNLLYVLYDEARRLWYYRWTFAVTTLFILTVGSLYVVRLPTIYDAWAQVYVSKDTPLTAATQAVGLGHEEDAGATANLVEKTFLSDQNLAPVVRQLDPAASRMSHVEAARAIEHLRSRIRVLPDQDDGLVEFHFADTNPARARNVVQSVLDAFLSESQNRSRQQLEQAATFLDQQVTAYQGMLSDAQAKMVGFRQLHPIVSALPAEPVSVAQVANVTNNSNQTQAAMVSPALAATNQKIQSLQSQLGSLRTQYTDQYPDVVSVKRQLDNAMSERSQEQSAMPPPQTAAASGESGASARPVRHVLRARRPRVSAVPQGVGSAWADLQRNDDVLQVSYQQLVARRDAVRMSLAAYGAEGGSRFQVIRSPVVPVLPIGPNRTLYLFVAAGFAAASGLAAAYLRGAISGVFVAPRELEEAFQLPVIGTVSWEPAWDTGGTKHSPPRLRMYAGVSLALVLGLAALAVASTESLTSLGAIIQNSASSAMRSFAQH